MSEKLCLQWNDFQENVNSAFGRLRNDVEFTDVTLACEDGQHMEAHKVILAASSPFFEKILQRSKHPHPMIYLKGFQSQDLLAILDFLYFGEANVVQENLDSFLAIAAELKLKGLTSPTSNEEQTNAKEIKKKTKERFETATTPKYAFNDELVPNVHPAENVSTALATFNQFGGDLQALDDKVKAMMEKSQNMVKSGKKRIHAFICKVCGREDKSTTIKFHIESKHLEANTIPCAQCEKTYPTRNALTAHKSRYHNAKV